MEYALSQKVFDDLDIPRKLKMSDTRKTKSQLINELEELRKKISETAELKENEEKYRVLVEQANDGVIIIQEQIVKYVNPRMAETLGYTVDEMFNTNFLDYVNLDEHSKIMDIYTRRIRGEDVPNIYELDGLHKNGSKVEIEINSGVGSFQGKPATIAFFHDTTERKKAEAALQKSEERFRTLFEDSTDAYLILQDNIFVDCNQATVDLLRANSKEEVLSTHPSELSPEFQPDGQSSAIKADEMIRIALEQGSNRFDWMHRRVDGEDFLVEVLLTPITVGGETIIHTSWRDITDRKRAERALKLQHELREAINRGQEQFVAENSAKIIFDGILSDLLNLTDSGYGFIAEVLFNPEGQPYLRSMAITNIAWDKETIEFHEKNIEAGLVFTNLKTLFGSVLSSREVVIANDPSNDPRSGGLPSGHPPLLAFFGIPIYLGEEMLAMVGLANRSGGYGEEIIDFLQPFLSSIGQFVDSLRNRTKRAAAEAEIRTLNEELEDRVMERTAELEEANKELEAFSYSISHDLRAPLRAINGFSEILGKDFTDKLDEEGLGFLNKIRDASLRMDQLINGLLNLSQLGRQSVKFESLDLFEMAGKIAENLNDSEPDREIDIQLQICDSIFPSARGDSNLIEILLTNLLSNALKFTRDADPAMVEFGCTVKDGESIYFVRDNGVGFDMAYAEKMFSPFQRLHSGTEYEGTGIGLALVQQVIRRHNGKIWVEAETGKGATFYFTLAPLL